MKNELLTIVLKYTIFFMFELLKNGTICIIEDS